VPPEPPSPVISLVVPQDKVIAADGRVKLPVIIVALGHVVAFAKIDVSIVMLKSKILASFTKS
jgi:hypothetical protein